MRVKEFMVRRRERLRGYRMIDWKIAIENDKKTEECRSGLMDQE